MSEAADFIRRWTAVQGQVTAFVIAAVRNREVADDIVQETAVALLEADSRYDPSQPFIAWSIGIARNQVHRWWRKNARSKSIPMDGEKLDLLVSASIDDGQDQLMQRRQAALHACTGTLRGRAWEAVRLHYGQGLGQQEASERLGIAIENLRAILYRSRIALRACIEKRLAESP